MKQKSTTEQSPNTPNNIAVAYLRVSTKDQSESGHSLESQKQFAMEYAEKNGLRLDRAYIFEETRPASTINSDKYDVEMSIHKRPVIKHILELASQKKFSKFIVYCRDRLTRNVEEYFAIKYAFKDYGIEICYSDPSEDNISKALKNKDANSKEKTIENLIEIVLSSISELEANIIGSRVRLGNQHCINLGLWAGGKVPFGYMAEEVKLDNRKRKNSKLSNIPYEGDIVKEIFTYYTSYGYSYSKLASIMNEKYPFKVWTKSSIESIITNQIYTGQLIWGRRGGRRNPNRKEPPITSYNIKDMEIINKSQWEETINLRHKKKELNDAKYYSTPFLLKGKLYCGLCNELMECKNYGPNKKKAYRCSTNGEAAKSHLILHRSIVEKKFIGKLSDLIIIQDIDYLWELYSGERITKINELDIKIVKNEEIINELKDKISRITSLSDDGIDYSIKLELGQLMNTFNKKLKHYEKILESDKDHLKYLHNSMEDFDLSLKTFLDNFDSMDINNKRMIIDLIIDKVVLTPDDNNNLSLEITINPPKLI